MRIGCVLSLVIVLACAPASSASEQVEKVKKAAYTSEELLQLDREAQWQFEPLVGRIDPFYDREVVLRAEQDLRNQLEKELQQSTAAENPNADVLVYAAAEQARIESLVAAKKYEEAIRTSDLALKRLEKNADLPEVQAAMTRITTFRDQADDALTRNEAQAQFDALGLKIEGILWSETGTRLVILSGESKAVGVNERVKDCVIINIDTDRVDFRFHYKRKRFEFPRYVGEDAKMSANSK